MNIEERRVKRKDTKISYIYQYAQCSLKQLKQYDKKTNTKPYCYGVNMKSAPLDHALNTLLSAVNSIWGGCGNFGNLTLWKG